MTLQAIYENPDEIPENFKELYAEKDGKFELTGIQGVKTEADVARLQTALAKERSEHKAARSQAQVWGDLDHSQVLADLDELSELRAKIEAGAANGFDEEKFTKAVDAKTATTIAPLKRDFEKAVAENATLKEMVDSFQQKERTRTIHDDVRKAASAAKIIPSAVEDVLMLAERMFETTDEGTVLAKDGVGVTPGIDPATWLSEMQEKRPHWWPQSTGGGANGSGSGGGFSNNPFSAEHWNMTEQGRLVVADPAKADRMAKAAGTTIGGQRPAAKK